MLTFATTKTNIASIVAGAYCIVGTLAILHGSMVRFSAVADMHKPAKKITESSAIPNTSTQFLLRTTELPNKYRMVEKITFGSEIPSSFILTRDGKILLNVERPSFSKTFDSSAHGYAPIPSLVYMTQAPSPKLGCVNLLSVVSLPSDGMPKFLLKDAKTWQAPHWLVDGRVDVDDLNLGVNMQPGDTTIDSSCPRVVLAWNGKSYVPSADSMRWDDKFGDSKKLMREYTKTLRHSYEASPRDDSAPLTPMVINRVYELIYDGNAAGAKRLLRLVYPHHHYLSVHLPFDYYFGSHVNDAAIRPVRKLTKAEVWQEMIAYLQKNSSYLSTLKELNPGLFRQTATRM